MAVLIKFGILLLGFVVGTLFVKYSFQLTQLFGHNDLAERYIGSGGTYTMWKLLGIIVIAGVVIYVFS